MKPLPASRLAEIATDACEQALAGVAVYEHSRCLGWNSAILNRILGQLVEETAAAAAPRTFKFVVNSTIVQQDLPRPAATASTTTSVGTSTSTDPSASGEKEGAAEAGAQVASASNSTPPPPPPPPAAPAAAAAAGGSTQARRGMHSASAAFWNANRDGCWNFKYDAMLSKGLDIVISVIWIDVSS
jgi:hypothetical protein